MDIASCALISLLASVLQCAILTLQRRDFTNAQIHSGKPIVANTKILLFVWAQRSGCMLKMPM